MPLTTIQCSLRWWCICNDSEALGRTTMRLILKRRPSSSTVGAPGPADRAVQAEGVVAATLEFLGDELDVLAARRVGHQQGVGVSTMIRSCTPTAPTRRFGESM